MPNRRASIQLTEDEIADFLTTTRHWLQVATIGRDGLPHLSPMGFTLIDGLIHFAGYGRSQKIVDLRRDPRITVMVEDGEQYDRLRGVKIRGRAELISDLSLTSRVIARSSGRHFRGIDPGDDVPDNPGVAKRVTVRVHPDAVISWDHSKLGGVH